MKRIYSSLIGICIFTLFLTGCQSVKEYFIINKPAKIATVQSPYLDGNIEVVDDHVVQNVDRTANVGGKTARLPVRFWETFTKSFKGVSDTSPYDRTSPYGKKDLQSENLSEYFKGVTQPIYMRGEKYAKAYRSPFIFKEDIARAGTNDMVTLSELGSDVLAQEYLLFQRGLDEDLDRAEKYANEERYAEALEIVDRVMEMDSSTQRGRMLFEKIIKDREANKARHEEEARQKLAKREKITQYISEAKEQLADDNFEEADRLAQMALSADPTHTGARELIDEIEVARFEHSLKSTGTSSLEILERLIHKHLTLYQQYSHDQLDNLAKKELQKVAILESYRDKIAVGSPLDPNMQATLYAAGADPGESEIAAFEKSLHASGISSPEILEKLIHKHLTLYQGYSDDGSKELAAKELQKVSILESYRDRLTLFPE
jgi:uncharacterized protein YqeY